MVPISPVVDFNAGTLMTSATIQDPANVVLRDLCMCNIYIYMFIYIYIYICIDTNIHICIYICMCIYRHRYIDT